MKMIKWITRNSKPKTPCKIDITIYNPDKKVINLLAKHGNKDLIFKEKEIHHKRYGLIGSMDDRRYNRLSKLEDFTYYWTVYNRTENKTGNVDDTRIIGKGFNLKIY